MNEITDKSQIILIMVNKQKALVRIACANVTLYFDLTTQLMIEEEFQT